MKQKTITLEALSKLSNLTPRHLRRLSDEGKLPRVTDSTLPMPEAMMQLFSHYQKVSEEMTAERLALLRARRRTAEKELGESQGDTLPRAATVKAIRSAFENYSWWVNTELERTGPLHRSIRLRDFPEMLEGAVQEFYNWDIADQQKMVDRIVAQCRSKEAELEAKLSAAIGEKSPDEQPPENETTETKT